MKISDELDAKLRNEAARRDTTLAEVVREALESHLGGDGRRRKFLSAAAGRSGFTQTARRIEEILAEEWTDPRSS